MNTLSFTCQLLYGSVAYNWGARGIAATNLPPRSRISQDPKRSSQQITPFYNARRNATKKNTQQHNRF